MYEKIYRLLRILLLLLFSDSLLKSIDASSRTAIYSLRPALLVFVNFLVLPHSLTIPIWLFWTGEFRLPSWKFSREIIKCNNVKWMFKKRICLYNICKILPLFYLYLYLSLQNNVHYICLTDVCRHSRQLLILTSSMLLNRLLTFLYSFKKKSHGSSLLLKSREVAEPFNS